MTTRLFRAIRDAAGRLLGVGCGHVIFSHSESNKGARYMVYTARCWRDAMTFLREKEVKEPLLYLIVETPEGNLGKDLISIFDERNGKTLEVGRRKPLLISRKSETHCSRCGYFVRPAAPLIESVKYFLSVDDMQKRGQGFFCSQCKSVRCAFCITLEGTEAPCPFCGASMMPHTKEP